DRPLGAKGFEAARMDLAKSANDIFLPQLEGGRAARVKPCRPAGNELQTAGRYAERRKKSESVGLGIEEIDSGGRHRPMPPGSFFFRHATPDRAGRDFLTFRIVAQEYLPDLKKRDIAMATV